MVLLRQVLIDDFGINTVKGSTSVDFDGDLSIEEAVVEPGATTDQSGVEIKAAYEANADTNAFTDADKTKLDNIDQEVATTSTPEFAGVITKEVKILQPTTATLISSSLSNTVISNYGQTVENTQTLPTCADGYNFMVQIEATGVGDFHLKAGATDKFYLDGTALDDGDKISCVDPEIGNYLVVNVIKTGASSFDWNAESGRGSWIDGGSV